MNIKLAHLFPEALNIYGDMGNIITLKKRCEWRSIGIEIVNIDEKNIDTIDFSEFDIFFMGGGQDNEQSIVSEVLKRPNIRSKIEAEVDANKVFLLICGAYQLFGKYYLGQKGERIEGLNILPIETYSISNKRVDRCIGDIVIHTELPIKPQTLVGFENHSGQTRFLINHPNAQIAYHLGEVLHGYGDNFEDKLEGIKYKNVFGTYLHGSLLPKNPQLADYIIKLAVNLKYNTKGNLPTIDSELELSAHRHILNRYKL